MDPDYEEALVLFADECFLQQFCSCYYNIPVVVDPTISFYCMTKGTHIGVFNWWYVAYRFKFSTIHHSVTRDQAAAKVLGVSGAVQYHVNSLDACHDRDCTYPCSPYPNLSTSFPSHQNHPWAPIANPESSDSTSSQLAS